MSESTNAEQPALIRQATADDLDDIMHIYDAGRKAMRASGNTAQWINGYPSRALVEDDIRQSTSFVMEGADGKPHGVFMFALCDDPTYHVIEDGAWLNDEPYGVIHRISSDGQLRGVMASAAEFGKARATNLRIDTHADNAPMQHVLEKAGFTRCGTIYCQDGSPRLAFQLSQA